jgi:hypothetical protein
MSAQESPMPETTDQEPAKKHVTWTVSVTDRLVSVGLSWARQTLSIGRRGLETSAKTLSQAAGSLDQWEKKLTEQGSSRTQAPSPHTQS